MNWKFFHQQLEKKNLDSCASELMNLFENRNISEDQVKTFHISTNMTSNLSTEPTPDNTTKMIYQFLMAIYQRNLFKNWTHHH